MKMNRGLAILIGVVISGSAMAANWDWDGDGGADTSWNNPLNWKNDAFYGASDIPIFRAGKVEKKIPIRADASQGIFDKQALVGRIGGIVGISTEKAGKRKY